MTSQRIHRVFRNRFSGSITLAAGLIMMVSSVNAASLTIDNFTDANGGPTQTVSQNGVGTNTDTDTALTGVLGGNRELFIDLTSDPNPAGGSTSVFTSTTRLSVSLNDSVDGTGGARYLALGGVDLTLGELLTNAFFQATVVSADTNVTLKVDITDTAAQGGDTASFTSLPLINGSFVNQAFASFSNSANVDFTQVESIVLTLSGPTSFDAAISLLEITSTPNFGVPEPSSLVLAGLGMIGLVGFALRRRFVK